MTHSREGTRSRLLRVAREILESEGLTAVTLRAVGAAAGVSRGAPYRHFADKSDLLAAVAAESLRMLAAAVDSAAQDTDDPVARIDQALRAYVDMALHTPELYSLTFGTDVRVAQSAELREAGLGAYGALRGLVGGANRSDLTTDLVTSMLWATMHGSVMLVLAGHTEPDPHLDSPLALVRHAASALLEIDLSKVQGWPDYCPSLRRAQPDIVAKP
jgi:AcrR family transcriptional regulator